MKIKSFVFNRNQTNTYVVSDEKSHEAIIIDGGCSSQTEFERLTRYIDEESINVKFCICTHLHYDHMLGASYINDRFGLKTIASLKDEYNLEWNKMSAIFMAIDGNERFLLNYNSFIWIEKVHSQLSIGNDYFQILETPGHSEGSISLYSESKKIIFSGDVIFEQGYGHTDFEGGNLDTLRKSIEILLDHPQNVTIFPGHGRPFKIEERLKTYII